MHSTRYPLHTAILAVSLAACNDTPPDPSDTDDTADSGVVEPSDTDDTGDASDTGDAPDSGETDEDTDADTDAASPLLGGGWSVAVPSGLVASVDGATAQTLSLVVGDPVDGRAWNLAVPGLSAGDRVALLRVDRPDDSPCAAPCATSSGASLLGEAVADSTGVAELSVAVPPGEVGTFHAAEAVRMDGSARSGGVVVEVIALDDVPLAQATGSVRIGGWAWVEFGRFHVYSYGDDVLIARNAPSNPFSPGLWSRFDVTSDGDDWYHCQSAYDAATYDDAVATAPAEDTDLAGGCGSSGFPWSQIPEPGNPFEGSYTDEWGSEHSLAPSLWTIDTSSFSIATVAEDGAWIIAKNGASNPFNPNLWSRFDLLDDGAARWYCQTAFDAETWLEARRTAAADPADPANAGCGGFGWTLLTP